MSKFERDHLNAVAELGCIVCRNQGRGWVEACIHHIKHDPETGRFIGAGRRASHMHTIPLCPTHHQYGGFGVAYHAGPSEWQKQYGTEVELWKQVQSLLQVNE